jgi:hypothetical protein
MSFPFVVLTRDAAELIRAASAPRGSLRFRLFDSDERFVVDQVQTGSKTWMGVRIPAEYIGLNWGGKETEGQWLRDDSVELAQTYAYLGRRPGAAIPFDVFRRLLGPVADPGELLGLVIVHHGKPLGHLVAPEFTGWVVSRSGVRPFDVQAEPEHFGPVQLGPSAAQLQNRSITIVGLGSIGSAAATAASEAGFARINLVDPDRLLWHNIVRHSLGPESIGRFKVDAMKAHLDSRARQFDPLYRSAISAHRLDVVEDVGSLYSILLGSDVVLCCADGIAPRRAVNHVARISGTPAVFACVLEDGAIGEVFRSRPGSTFGCLLCHRSALQQLGALDPERNQELDYGTGNPHKPMSASPTDLRLMGALAAKIAVSTIRESLGGDLAHRLPGEQLVMGLRPADRLPAPFNVRYSGEVIWNSVPAPRPECATCSIS